MPLGKKGWPSLRKNRDGDWDATGAATTLSTIGYPNPFEDTLKRGLAFEAQVCYTTDSPEPDWSQPHDEDSRLIPGWAAAMTELPLRTQGTSVAESKKAIDEYLAQVELGGNIEVAGIGGGMTPTGLPRLLKDSFTSYQWLIM